MAGQAQYTGTTVMASGDVSDWGSSSGLRARQGEAVDAGDDDNDGLGLWLARTAVAQGSAPTVAQAQQGSVRARQLCRARQAEPRAQGY